MSEIGMFARQVADEVCVTYVQDASDSSFKEEKMNRLIAAVLVFSVVLTALAGSSNVVAQESEMDAAAVVEGVYAAVEMGDIDAAVELLAEDAVLTLVPAPGGMDGTFVGKEEIGGWFENLAAENGRFEFSDIRTEGNTATLKLLFHSDHFDGIVGGPAEFDGAAVVQDGLWKAVSWVFTPEFIAEMDAAMARQADRVTVERYFEELWNQGDFAGFDEIIAEEFMSHSYPMIDGDRDVLKEDIAAFRAENPNAYFTFDDITLTGDRAFVINTMMMRPEGAAADAEGEPAGSPMVLVLGLEDGKITDRWLYMHAE